MGFLESEDEISGKKRSKGGIIYKGGGALGGGIIGGSIGGMVPIAGPVLAPVGFVLGAWYGYKGGKKMYEHVK